MSAPSPTGPIAVSCSALRTLLANLPIFQTITGSADAAAALGRVFDAEVGQPIVRVTALGGLVTIELPRIHAIEIGDTVTVQGASLGEQAEPVFAGEHEVVSVTTTEVVVSYALAAGEYTPDQAFLLPCARPFAVVTDSADGGLRSSTIGTGGSSVLSGTLEILLESDVSSEAINDPAWAMVEMRNTAGELLRQLIQTQGTGDFIVLNDAELVSCDFIAAAEQNINTSRFERWRALIRCTWGLDG